MGGRLTTANSTVWSSRTAAAITTIGTAKRHSTRLTAANTTSIRTSFQAAAASWALRAAPTSWALSASNMPAVLRSASLNPGCVLARARTPSPTTGPSDPCPRHPAALPDATRRHLRGRQASGQLRGGHGDRHRHRHGATATSSSKLLRSPPATLSLCTLDPELRGDSTLDYTLWDNWAMGGTQANSVGGWSCSAR